MNWREELESVIIWMRETGMDRDTLVLERVGPLYKVSLIRWRDRKDPDSNVSWHLTYNGARIQFLRHKLNLQEEYYPVD